MEPGQVESGSEAAVSRALATLRARTGMDIAFGARINADGKAMRILQINGGLTRSLHGLTIASGAGLGGKTLAMGQPARVHDYPVARGITHTYDYAVSQERLRTVASLPVRVGHVPRYVVYLAHRSPVELGDRWIDRLAPVLRDLERELAVQEELNRRLRQMTESALEQPALSSGELREIAAELAALAGEVLDEGVRSRLQALRDRVDPGQRGPVPVAPEVSLTPREIAVLEHVAAGCSNAAVAERLGLLPNTVKSYLKSAMRKLGVSNRVQAIVAARAAGVIR